MKKRHKALLWLTLIVAGIPFLLWLSWVLTTPCPLSVFVMDKSSYSKDAIKYRSIHWVLNHYRFVKPNGSSYDASKDYYGFFPLNRRDYKINDLSKMSTVEIQRLAQEYDVAYYSDSYGVYSDEWPLDKKDTTATKKIYGGLDWEDMLFVEYMLRMKHLVIAEFIFMAPPTPNIIRKKAEELMGLEWKSWSGRFFHTLNRHSADFMVPSWITGLYESQTGKTWNFTRPGLVLVHENGTLVVLEELRHLKDSQLKIHTDASNSNKYGMAENVAYSGWFDITFPTSQDADVVSWYELDPTDEGTRLLAKHNIPSRFPAVIIGNNEKKMVYLAGDFGHSPIKTRFVRLKGARYAELFLADLNDPMDTSGFFLTFYLPLLRKILTHYHKSISSQ